MSKCLHGRRKIRYSFYINHDHKKQGGSDEQAGQSAKKERDMLEKQIQFLREELNSKDALLKDNEDTLTKYLYNFINDKHIMIL